jgi:oligopeptide transport system permease protein
MSTESGTHIDLDMDKASAIARMPTSLDDSRIVRRSLWMDAVRRFRRNRLAMLGLFIVLFLAFLAIFADLLAPYRFNQVFFTIRHPILPFTNPDHLLGTDTAGRDYLSRLIHGSRTSLFIGLTAPIIAFSIGLPLGALAGYKGGYWDLIVMRLIEIGTGIPGLIFALLILSVAGTGVGNVILALSITSWIGSARIARGQFIATRDREFVVAARALGATDRQIILNHIFPNAFSPLLIAFSLAIPTFIFAEAGLSFLGLGITEPTPSWGKMVGGSVGTTVRIYWHLALMPTILIALTMLGFSFVGDGLQEALDVTRSE